MDATNPEFVAGLRALADWYEAHPEAEVPNASIGVYPPDTLDNLREWSRRLGTFSKNGDDYFLRLQKSFGPLTLNVNFYRQLVCEKRVVGTKKVVEKVPDPEAPKVTAEVTDPDAPLIEIEREEEIVEWDCPPLLAPEKEQAA